MRKSLVLLPALLLVALVFPLQVSFAQTGDPATVLIGMGQAYLRGDLDTAILFFAEDAVLKEVPAITIKDTTTFTGRQQIRQWMQKNIDIHAVGTSPAPPTINGDKITAFEQFQSDELKKAGIDNLLKNVEVVVTGGKIKSLTYTLTPESVEKLKQAGLVSGSATTDQSSQSSPTGAPAAGSGGSVPRENDLSWLAGLLLLVGLSALAGLKFKGHRPNR